MTIAQKMRDERKLGFREGQEEGLAKGEARGLVKGREEGREEGKAAAVFALNGVLEPEVIARQFKMPLERVLEILQKES